MKYKLIIGHEVILLISCLSFGALLLPAAIFMVLAPFGILSEAKSFGDCYDILFQMLGGSGWLPFLFFFGPYVIMQTWRFYKGTLGRDYIEDSTEDDEIFSFSNKIGNGCMSEFSGMSWKGFSTKGEEEKNLDEK